MDGGIFSNTVKLLPYWHKGGILQDQKFLDDRAKLSNGFRMSAELMERGRPDGLVHMRQAFELLESTFLADGRKWVLGTENPSLADLDAVWPFEWLIAEPGMTGALPEGFEERFPKVFAYVRRFMERVEERKKEGRKPESLDMQGMKEKVMHSARGYEETTIIEDDPLGLKKGDDVEVFPSDYGSSHKDRGSLVGLTLKEVVIKNDQGLHLHFPRWNFRIEKVAPSKSSIPASISTSKTASIPNMRLIYHPMSPYSRKVFITALELGLAQHITLQKVVVCPVPFEGWSDNNEDVAKFNPLTKIPCLIPEDMETGIYDSRIICEYLENLASAGVSQKNKKLDNEYWQTRTLHACADGIMDAVILLVYEKRIREPKGLKLDEWVEGQITKIKRGLDRLEGAVKQGVLGEPKGEAASADAIAVAVALPLMDGMGIEWRSGREGLVKWFGAWEKRSSFLETPGDREWVGKEGKGGSKI